MQSSTIAEPLDDGQNFAMADSLTTPATLPDEELQSLASEWRIRAMQGDQLAHRMAQALEAEQRRRIRDTGLMPLLPERPAGPDHSADMAPWWKFW
jgi:hypothetical protein